MIKIILCGNINDNRLIKNLIENNYKLEVFSDNLFCIKEQAYFKKLKIYESIDEISQDIDLAYISYDTDKKIKQNIAIKFLEKGINVLEENPNNKETIIKCLQIAKEKKVHYIIQNFYEKLSYSNILVNLINVLTKQWRILGIEGNIRLCNIYSFFNIVESSLNKKILEKNFNYKKYYSYFLITGDIYDIPICIKILDSHREKDIYTREENLKFFFEEGVLVLDFFAEQLIWHGRECISSCFVQLNELNKNPNEIILKSDVSFLIKRNDVDNECEKIINKTFTKITQKFNLKEFSIMSQDIIKNIPRIEILDSVIFKESESELNMHNGINSSERLQTFDLENMVNMYRMNALVDSEKEVAKSIEDSYLFSKEYNIMDFQSAMNYYICCSILKLLQKKGLFLEVNKKYSVGTINSIGNNSKSIRILKRWIKQLEYSNFIKQNDNEYMLKKDVRHEKMVEELNKAKSYWSWKLGDPLSIEYIEKNVSNLLNLFDGEVECNTLLFPNGELKYAKALYKNNLIYRYINDCIAYFILSYINNKFMFKDGNEVNILEIGSGIGATSERVFEVLSGERLMPFVKYNYTDISGYFLNYAKNHFKDRKNIEYKKLNIDEVESIEKFKGMDVIIAVGVLNNAKFLHDTMKGLFHILNKDGIIYIAEPTKESPEMLVSQVFMMEEPNDIRRNSNMTFLNKIEWLSLLRKTGFNNFRTYPPQDVFLSEFGQCLFIAEK